MEPENRKPSLNGINKWAAVLFVAVSVVLGSLVFKMYSNYRQNRNEISDVNSLIMSDAACRREFKQMQIPDLVDYLQYVHRINPNFKDPTLDVVANNEKKGMASDIIKELYQRTGDSLGDNPEAWVKKYGYGSTNSNLKTVAPGK